MGSLAQEEYDLMKDSKYRVYVSAVDKALKNFEYTSEWADLISALGKLNKVLVNNMKFPVIPRRIKISKRLAQCMHPALPSGVHLKALETYDAIFKCMGTNRLAHELFIYSAGLFPLLGHAAMNVRLLLLTVYETHFIPLGERLRPALSGFLSGVLPGLESGSDHFDSTNALLEKVCEGVGAAHFYSCMWECLACNSSTRFPAISFVLSHFNKRLSMADQLYIMGKDVDVLVTGLCACMRDSSVLVQRCALELLLVGFPMHSSQLLRADMVRLIIAGLTTILRRDMSLNRRLYAWLLGSEVNTSVLKSEQVLIKKAKLVARNDENFIPYFELYSRDLLIHAIRVTLAESARETPPDLKPYRLLMSLLDKAEIGPVILDDILYDVFRTLYLSCGNRKTEKNFEEILKSANMLFSALEPYYIWEYVGILYGEACNSEKNDEHTSCPDRIVKLPGSDNENGICTNLLEVCTLTQYLLDTLPLETYVDTTSEHLPSLFLKITELLTENSDLLLIDEIMNSICLCKKIVSRIQTVVTNTPKIDVENISSRLSISMMEITRQPNDLRTRNEKLPNLEKSKSDSKLNDVNKGLTDNTLNKMFAESSRSLKYNENTFPENMEKDSNSTTTTTNEADKYSDESFDEESNCILKNTLNEKPEVCTNNGSGNSTPDPINTEKQSLLEKCIRCYESFFVQFISRRLLHLGKETEPTHIDELFKTLLLIDDQSSYLESDNSVNVLESMLYNTLRLSRSQDFISSKEECKCDSMNVLPKPLITDQSNYSALQRAVKLACRLLVELSTFPTYIPQELNINLNQNFDGMQIPEWLKVLVLCACFLKNAPDLQLPAVSTVLDLITLLRTQLECNDAADGLGPRKTGVGVTSVVMIPLLRQWHVEYLEKSTRVFQILAYSLWEHLACPTLEDQLMTWASLLHQLHNCLPTNNVVEMVLGESMNSEDPGQRIESFHRFSTLWHLGRNMEGKACSRAMRSFDKTLLKMLDNLQLPESSPLKLFAASWVIHSLLRGDIHRLLDPVLFILLDPLTARMSILHVSIRDSSTRLMQRTTDEYDTIKQYDNSTSPSSKIYAISSVDGNVIYHVSDNVHTSMTKAASKSFTKKILNPLKSRKLYSLTGSKDKNSSKGNVTGKHYTAKDVLNSGLTVSTQNISLFVNPFSTTDVCSDDNCSVEDPVSNLGSKQDLFNTSRFKRSDSEYGLCSEGKRSSTSSNTSIKLSSNIDIVQFTCNKTDRKTLLIKNKQSSSESTSSNSYESSHDISHTSFENNIFESTLSQKFENDLIIRSKSVSGPSSKPIDLPLTPSKSAENISKFDKGITSNLNDIVSNNVLTTELTNRTAGMIEQFEMSLHEIKDGSLYTPEICVASEFELSTAAEEYFNESSSVDVVKGVLNSIIDKVCDTENGKKHSKPEYDRMMTSKSNENCKDLSRGVHQLHTHMLLYCEVYDSNRTLYALQTLRNEILSNTRVFLCSAATTGIANVPKGIQLLNLLARHKKSIYGHGFYGDISNTEYMHSYRSCMYLEVLITICLHFARSYYPNLGNVKLTPEEISGNRKVQLASVELLMLICTELISIVRDSGKGFSCYIADLLSKCKVQKIILHCVMSSVHIMKTVQYDNEKVTDQSSTFTEEIMHFNDPYDSSSVQNRKCKSQITDHTEGFQIQLLRLLLSLIMLEYQVHIQKGDDATNTPVAGKESPTNTVKINHLKYVPNSRIPQQPMFLAAVLMALQLEYIRHLHQHWTTLLTSALPYMGSSLTHIVISVIHQLCTNIEKISSLYHSGGNKPDNCCLPPDYTVTQLEALTVVCHYCLLDSNQQLSHVFNQSFSHGLNTGMSSTNPGQIFNNLIHVFMPTPLSQDAATSKGSQLETHLQARRVVLSHMPRIIASMAALWENVTSLKDWEHRSCVLGNPDVVKHQLLEFLSPVSLHHGINFLAAIAVAWLERRDITSSKKVLPVANTNQQVLVYLVSEIRVMPMDSLVQTVHQVLKSPPPIHGAKQDLTLDVGILELFYWYMQTASSAQLSDIWPSLLGLLRDGLTLSAPGQFLIIAILNEYVQKCPQFVEKRDQRDLHDITSKIVESISQIAGCCLEQTTWLRRNLAVKEEPQINSTANDDKDGSHSPSLNGRGSQMQSVQAQSVLAELLATLLDVAYGSQDKEKVVAILTTLMYNITPYLKNHTQYNAPAFKACSHLLSSLSGYQYTRKAWRKDVFDLLLDTALFQMECSCLVYWRTIIDNLMTHDNSTFRDFMARVSMTQSGSLSIFSSREQEYEQRAQLLRRLAFVIFCSEVDQYHKYMPEIQEQLASSLRLLQVVPSVQANVFLCFRVLLLRMSPQHVTSLWPIIISEMVQVFLHIEQELATYSEEFRTNSSFHIRLLSALDYTWVTNSNNGLHAHGHPHWLQLQLATAKLLDLALVLPATALPQFQMYRWAFVNDSDSSVCEKMDNDLHRSASTSMSFVPHVTRIARLMDARYADSQIETIPCKPGELLLTGSSIKSLQELHSFFKTLSMRWHAHRLPDNCLHWDSPGANHSSSPLTQLETVLENDFLEKLSER